MSSFAKPPRLSLPPLLLAGLMAGIALPATARSDGAEPEAGASCARVEQNVALEVQSQVLPQVDWAQAPPPLQPYTDAERACWVDWERARQLAAQGAQWVDARETGATRGLRLVGALAVPREALANSATLRGLDVLLLGDDVDLRALSQQCVLWRQTGRLGSVHVVRGGVRAWRLAGQPVQADPRIATPIQPPDVVTPAEYRQGMADDLWRVVTLGIPPDQARTLHPARDIATADEDALHTLRQTLAQANPGDAASAATLSASLPWLAITADAATQARLQALWRQQQSAAPAAADHPPQASPTPPLLWLDGGLHAYRNYLAEQRQLAAHAGQALPRSCGI